MRTDPIVSHCTSLKLAFFCGRSWIQCLCSIKPRIVAVAKTEDGRWSTHTSYRSSPLHDHASSHCRKTSWCLVELPSPLEGIVERQGWAGPLQNVAARIQALAGITRVSPGGPMPVGRADHRTGSCAFPLACPGHKARVLGTPTQWTPRGTSTNRSGRRMESSIPWLHAPTVLTTCSRLV
jgi:hypothetical protein